MAYWIYDLVRRGVAGVRRFRKIPLVAWTVFLTVSLPGFGGLGESVLCFGADGHIAFEPAAPGGLCSSASGRTTPHPAGSDRSLDVSSRNDHCGPCVDFPVLVNDSGRCVSPLAFHKANPAPFAGGTPATLVGSSMPGMQAGRLHSGIRHDLPAPTSTSLRNTVLLI
jgi:hypothetical protein